MDSHTLTVLEYGELLSSLAGYAHSEPGKQLALNLRPSTTRDETLQRLQHTKEAFRLYEDAVPDLSSVTDVSVHLGSLRIEGSVLDREAILSLLANQKAVRSLKKAIKGHSGDLSILFDMGNKMSGYPGWEKWAERSFTPKGELADAASPGLMNARKESRRAREAVTQKLEEFAKKERVARVLRETYVTLRNERFVIPAKPEYHRIFEGVVQDSSQSGQTLFVEPLFAVELNNNHTKAQARIRDEIRKVLAGMSDELRPHREELHLNQAVLAQFDLLFAKVRLAARMDGTIVDEDTEATWLEQARHPHLLLNNETACVPIDIGIGGDADTFVITGPNTGGKTVALKTLGLLTLMHQSGIPVPVGTGSRFRVFEKIYADIGDEQSLAQSLSTFSAHISIISHILENSDDKTLVLLDELGAGTDPQEGSALGVAILEELNARGACVVATTHHNLLKEFAYRSDWADNASTVFDTETLEPTYELRLGTPGRSHALQIAEQLDIKSSIVMRAREIIGSGAARIDKLLGRLTEEVDRETVARERAENALHEIEAERQKLKAKQDKLGAEVHNIKEKARKNAKTLIRELERRSKELLKDMQAHREEARLTVRNEISRMEVKVSKRLPAPRRRKSSLTPVKKDQEVRVLSIGVIGTIIDITGSEAEVQAGGVRMRVPLAGLEPASETRTSADPEPVRVMRTSYEGDSHIPSEINLLGSTVDEALQSMDNLLDRSLMGSGKRLRIVHGKGTGALKNAINRALQKDPRVASHHIATLEEGGSGVTIVELKD